MGHYSPTDLTEGKGRTVWETLERGNGEREKEMEMDSGGEGVQRAEGGKG